MSARFAAVKAIMQIQNRGGYSNIVLDELLSKGQLSGPDKALATRLVYGVVERRLTLEYCLSRCSSMPMKKMHPVVAASLLVAAYQLLYMDNIPPSAAVNEAVKLVKSMKQGHAAGFVNGVLRGLLRQKDQLLADLPAGDEGLSILYSCPVELIRFWRRAYGEEILQSLLAHLNDQPPAILRVNTLLATDQELIAAFAGLGVTLTPVESLPHYLTAGNQRVTELKLEKQVKSWYYYQDTASGFCCQALQARPGQRVLDVCAAPGGKSFTIAQHMDNRGDIVAADIHPAKCDLMEQRARQYGIRIIRTLCRDATEPLPTAMEQAFDRVLCDVPCSGLGVIRRKPEIRYKDLASFAGLPELQYRILEQSAKAVKPGGMLQYSTCTLHPAENREVVERFLAAHPRFAPRPLEIGLDRFANPLSEPDWYRTLFPHIHGTDGFFIAGFVAKE